eukprot:TRINITY_DN1665_c1_g1_i3.p1 TRINITY_DN1665_c1_g1~~TRINITY_DN1665_c1_g1_i3.p1  ORF type:complete len:872 (+),score=158.96 TRINITY_DN1665_c1_g1_i3:183-2798(+)
MQSDERIGTDAGQRYNAVCGMLKEFSKQLVMTVSEDGRWDRLQAEWVRYKDGGVAAEKTNEECVEEFRRNVQEGGDEGDPWMVLAKVINTLDQYKVTRKTPQIGLHREVLDAARGYELSSSEDNPLISPHSSMSSLTTQPSLGTAAIPVSIPSAGCSNPHFTKKGVLRSPSMSSHGSTCKNDAASPLHRRDRKVSFKGSKPFSPTGSQYTSPGSRALSPTDEDFRMSFSKSNSRRGFPVGSPPAHHQYLSTPPFCEDLIAVDESDDEDSAEPKHEVTETNEVTKKTDAEGNKRINQYTVVQEIGRGAYGKVKLALHVDTDTNYAIKILNKLQIRKKNANALHLAQQEVAILKKLRHKNIVSLYEVIYDEDSNKMYMVLEYAEGGCAMRLDKDGNVEGSEPLSMLTVRKYFRDLVSGLRYSHKNGIIHRDIKPENLLLDRDGNLKLTDFGVSAIVDDDDDLYDTEGTPAFQPPEALCSKLSRQGISGKAVDVWAIGVTLYVFVYGRLPFWGNCRRDMVNSIKEDVPTFTETSHRGEPVDHLLESLLESLLEKEAAVRIDLEAVARNMWVRANGAPLTPVIGGTPSGRRTPPDMVPDLSLGSPMLSASGRDRSRSIISVNDADISNAISFGRGCTLNEKVKIMAQMKRRMSFKLNNKIKAIQMDGNGWNLYAILPLAAAVLCKACVLNCNGRYLVMADGECQTVWEWDDLCIPDEDIRGFPKSPMSTSNSTGTPKSPNIHARTKMILTPLTDEMREEVLLGSSPGGRVVNRLLPTASPRRPRTRTVTDSSSPKGLRGFPLQTPTNKASHTYSHLTVSTLAAENSSPTYSSSSSPRRRAATCISSPTNQSKDSPPAYKTSPPLPGFSTRQEQVL